MAVRNDYLLNSCIRDVGHGDPLGACLVELVKSFHCSKDLFDISFSIWIQINSNPQ